MTGTAGRRLVLASSPAVGPLLMERLADALRSHGAAVDTPVAHADVVQYVAAAGGVEAPDALVGYSGGGPRLFAVAERLLPRAVVFVDAGLPVDGIAPDADPVMAALLGRLPVDERGLLPPWPQWFPSEVLSRLCPDAELLERFAAECPSIPRSTYSQPVPAPAFAGPCAYLALGDNYEPERLQAEARGWPTATLPLGHLAPMVAPDQVAATLLELIERVLP